MFFGGEAVAAFWDIPDEMLPHGRDGLQDPPGMGGACGPMPPPSMHDHSHQGHGHDHGHGHSHGASAPAQLKNIEKMLDSAEMSSDVVEANKEAFQRVVDMIGNMKEAEAMEADKKEKLAVADAQSAAQEMAALSVSAK